MVNDILDEILGGSQPQDSPMGGASSPVTGAPSYEEWVTKNANDPVLSTLSEGDRRLGYAKVLEKFQADQAKMEQAAQPQPRWQNPFSSPQGFLGPGIVSNVGAGLFDTTPQKAYDATIGPTQELFGLALGGVAGQKAAQLLGAAPRLLPAAGRVVGATAMSDDPQQAAIGALLGEGTGASLPWLSKLVGVGGKATEKAAEKIPATMQQTFENAMPGQATAQPLFDAYGRATTNLVPPAVNTTRALSPAIESSRSVTAPVGVGPISPTAQTIIDLVTTNPMAAAVLTHMWNSIQLPSWMGGKTQPGAYRLPVGQ